MAVSDILNQLTPSKFDNSLLRIQVLIIGSTEERLIQVIDILFDKVLS